MSEEIFPPFNHNHKFLFFLGSNALYLWLLVPNITAIKLITITGLLTGTALIVLLINLRRQRKIITQISRSLSEIKKDEEVDLSIKMVESAVSSADFSSSIPTLLDIGSTRQRMRSPQVMRTHLHAYPRRIYMTTIRTGIGL